MRTCMEMPDVAFTRVCCVLAPLLPKVKLKKGRLPWRWSGKGGGRRGSQGQRQQSVSCGTPSYAAPEIITSSDEQR